MDTNDLKDALSKLHIHLEKNQPIDTELRDLLQVLDSDIHHLLGRGAPQAVDVDDADDEASLAGRTQAISAKFAVNHPRLEPVLRELGAILERMGI
jgi:hypothetical protein